VPDKPTEGTGWFRRTGVVLFFMMVGLTIGKLFFGAPTLTESAANPGAGPGKPELIVVCAAVGVAVGFFVQRSLYRRG
jgi:uncharacterized membrane protein